MRGEDIGLPVGRSFVSVTSLMISYPEWNKCRLKFPKGRRKYIGKKNGARYDKLSGESLIDQVPGLINSHLQKIGKSLRHWVVKDRYDRVGGRLSTYKQT